MPPLPSPLPRQPATMVGRRYTEAASSVVRIRATGRASAWTAAFGNKARAWPTVVHIFLRRGTLSCSQAAPDVTPGGGGLGAIGGAAFRTRRTSASAFAAFATRA